MKNLYRTPQQLHTILFRRGNQMNKRKISGKQLLSDIKSGMSDAQLMAKHDLTPKGLQSALSKLVEAGLLNAASLRERGLVKTGPKPGTFEVALAPLPDLPFQMSRDPQSCSRRLLMT